jgi:hypothetical protein
MMGAAWDERDNLPPAKNKHPEIVSAIALKSRDKLGSQMFCPSGGMS